MLIQAEHALLGLEAATLRIGRALTSDAATTPPSAELRRRLAALRGAEPERSAELEKRSPSEQHRQFLLHVVDRLRATRSGARERYASPTDLLDDLRSVQSSLARACAPRQAYGRYGVSFSRTVGDIAAVYELAEHTKEGMQPVLDVIPLFETIDDLHEAPNVMEHMLGLAPVKLRLAETGRGLEVMLGYSDSTKEVGPLSATLALYEAQSHLTAWAKERGVRLTMFHGRGGALGRGGGPANRAVRAQAAGSVAGRFKVTEQGEVIFARYGNAAIARRHLEQVASAVLEATTTPARSEPSNRFRKLAAGVDAASRAACRALVASPGFNEWVADGSPLEELGRMRIASSPPRPGGGE